MRISNFTSNYNFRNTKNNSNCLGFSSISTKPVEAVFIAENLNSLGIDFKKLQVKLSSETFKLLSTVKENFSYCHTLIDLSEKLTPVNKKRLKQMLISSLKGKSSEFLFDSNTVVGRNNLKTEKSFENEGLNFNQWLNYKGKHQFEVMGKPHEIELWKREPIKDIFLGNQTDTCIATNNINNDIIFGALANTNSQYLLARNKTDGKITNYARIMVLKSQQTKEKFLYFDFTKNYPKHSDEFINFLGDYSKSVLNYPDRILINSSINCTLHQENGKFCPISDDDTFIIVGKTLPNTKIFPYCEGKDNDKIHRSLLLKYEF